MPIGSRVRSNNVFGLVTDNPLTASTTTLNSNGLANLPSIIAGTQHAVVTLDPLRVNGAPEIILVTNHGALASVATITRGLFGTTARSHPQGTLWTHTPMNEDYVSIVTSVTRPSDPYQGELVYETDTALYRSWNGTSWVGISGDGLAGGTLAFQISALDQTANSGDTLTSLSCTVTVPAGRLLKISASSQVNSSASSNWLVDVLEDGVVIGRLWVADFPNISSRNEMDGFVLRSPSAGTHTYSFSTTRFGGSGTLLIEGTAQGKRSTVEDVTGSATPFNNSSVPVGQIAYAQVVANQTGITTSVVPLTGLSVNVVVASGRSIMIRGKVDFAQTVATVNVVELQLFKDGAQVQRGKLGDPDAQSESQEVTFIESPSAGSHTYDLRAVTDAGTVSMVASATLPAFISVQDITSTPTASNGAPSSTLAYAEVLANQGTFTAETDLTGLSVTINVPAGRRLKITGSGFFGSSVANDVIRVPIQEDGVQIASSAEMSPASPFNSRIDTMAIRSPSAGSHTYKLRAARDSGTGNITMAASAIFPAFILVEDITGAIWPAGSTISASLVASEAWTTYVPVVTQSTPVTNTVTYARYIKIGRQVTFQWLIVIVGTGVASNAVNISLPVASFNNGGGAGARMIVGTVQIFDTSANLYYQGLSSLDGGGASQLVFYPTNSVASLGSQFLGLSQFTAALAAGDVLSGSVVYESAT